MAETTDLSQERCRVFRRSPWVDQLHCDDFLMKEIANMNKSDNRVVDKQLGEARWEAGHVDCFMVETERRQVLEAFTSDVEKSLTGGFLVVILRRGPSEEDCQAPTDICQCQENMGRSFLVDWGDG